MIHKQYGGGDEFAFPDQALAETTVSKVTIETITGKQSGY